MKKQLFLIGILMMFGGCNKEGNDRETTEKKAVFEECNKEGNDNNPVIVEDDPIAGTVVTDTKFITQLKNEAVDTLTIGVHSYTLDAYLWRDFMPVSPPNGKRMIAINWLIEADSVEIPGNITLVKQYMIYEDSVWIADYTDEPPAPSLPAYKLEKVSRNGPKWGPEVTVDVIARVHDSQTDKDYYVGRKNVYIGRTD